MRKKFDNIKLIVFDADDTLWDCQSHYERVINIFCKMYAGYGDAKTLRKKLLEIERANMPLLGYGTKAFTLSLMQAAWEVSDHGTSSQSIMYLKEQAFHLFRMPITPLPEVEYTLAMLNEQKRFKLAVLTKGDPLDQESKLQRSGLRKYFQHVDVVSEKTANSYLAICDKFGCDPKSMLAVGNSMPSDIFPAFIIGAATVYIPFHVTWELETSQTIEEMGMTELTHFADILELV